MTTEQITIREDVISRLNHRPFEPFSVQLADGTRHFIVRVGQMAVGLTTGIIADPRGDGSRKINLSEITSTKTL
jgi:hypothetical protein